MLTSREEVELFALEVQCLLITEQVRVVQSRLVHELQRLGDEENRKHYQVDLPPNFPGLLGKLA